jgi:beta-N-acetylhexosaminidase
VRRPRALAIVLAPLALSAAIVAARGLSAAGTPAGKASAVQRLSGRQLVGERIVVGFDGRRIPADLRKRVRHGTVAGVILFSGNYGGRKGARRLVHRLQSIPRRAPLRRLPLLVMLDQEGGLVKRLAGPPRYSAGQMGHRSRALCRRQGAATGRLLRRVGVNVDLAPVLDVARPGSAIGAQDRAFGDSARQVIRKGDAFARGLEGARVAATGKHFPGLGAAPEDTDFHVQRIHVSRRKLRHVDERPYARYRDLGGGVVMLSTAIYPAFDPRLPAALSRELATGELRDRVHFHGVSITDALGTVSAHDIGGPKKLARLGAHAGTDLLLFTSLGDGATATNALSHALRHHTIPRENFRRSARRVLALRDHLPG